MPLVKSLRVGKISTKIKRAGGLRRAGVGGDPGFVACRFPAGPEAGPHSSATLLCAQGRPAVGAL